MADSRFTSETNEAAAAGALDAGAGSLADFVASVSPRELRVEENLGEGYVRLRVDEAERRQAKHDIRCIEDAVVEMLRNARDAGARNVYVATSREGDVRTTTIVDDGQGVPQDMQDRIFDARVTSKLETMRMDRWGVHGRGMALFSVRENAESAKVMASAPGKGTSIQVVSDVNALGERRDQSTWPVIGTDDDGEPSVVRGPHNIVRTCAEFALEERGTCKVYVGSAAEVVATARARVRQSVSGAGLLFLDDLSELPLLERLKAAADASELLRVAGQLGLEISERTAHRILAGQIKPLRDAYARLAHHAKSEEARERAVNLERDRRGLKLDRDDAEEFSRIMERDFAWLAQRYYLSLAKSPKVTAGQGRVTVTFELSADD